VDAARSMPLGGTELFHWARVAARRLSNELPIILPQRGVASPPLLGVGVRLTCPSRSREFAAGLHSRAASLRGLDMGLGALDPFEVFTFVAAYPRRWPPTLLETWCP
jgi:hypothetical protein